MNKTILTIFLVLGSVSLGLAQKRAAWINAADTAFYAEKNYYQAFKYYEAALLYDTTDIDIWYRKAEAARMFNAYFDAEEAYLKVINSERLAEYPCALAYAGQMRLNMGGYEQAEAYFQRFLKQFPQNSDGCKELVNKGMTNISFVRSGLPAINEDIKLNNIGQPVNTAFSDFGVYPVDDGFYFSRYEYEDYTDKKAPGRRFVRIFKATGDGDPEMLSKDINPDTSLHFGHSAFNRDGSRFYYTICRYEKGVNVHCDLFFREIDQSGQWGDAIPVQEINLAGFTTTQPSIGWTEGQEEDALYFVSDRPGGMGGFDIWKSLIVNGSHQTPINLGAGINTADDEATPFFHPFSQRLFFSSTGHTGYGGYDVFFTRWDGDAWSPAENMGAPINTSTDEVYYSLDRLGNKAYFSSNRLGSTLFEVVETDEEKLKEACCLDIYSYEMPACDLIVNTFRACDESENNGEALSSVRVQIFDITEGEPGKLLVSSLNERGNDIQFAPLQPYRKYKILASKDRFDDASAILDFTNVAFPCPDGDTEILDICLKESCPTPALQVQVVDPSGEAVPDVSLRIVKLGDSATFPMGTGIFGTEDGGVCPDDLLGIYGSFPDEQIIEPDQIVPIEYDTYYGVIATKELFTFDTAMVRVSLGEVEGPDCARQVKLQIERISELNELTLYFDNDSPNPDTRLVTTDSNYIDVFKNFYKKKNEFRAQFSEGPQDFLESQELESFFERELRGNAERMYSFSDSLLTLLCRGASIDLEMNGCASPRFNDKNNVRQRTYNEALTKRRIDSVINFFETYSKNPGDPPIFKDFLGSQLRIIKVDKACQVADREELSDLKDRKNSIFSIDASVARRVEVRVKFRPQQQ